MHYVIYIDKVWLMDFVISTYLLLLVRKTCGLRSSIVRLLLCAAVGAAVFVFFLLLPGVWLPVKLFLQAVCVEYLLLKTAFSFRTKEMAVRSYICMSGYGLLLGGFVCFVSGYLPGKRNPDLRGTLFAVTLAAGAVWLYLHIRKKRKRDFCTVKLDFYGETCVCRALVDSGNGLREPYGGRPVSVLEKQAAGELLSRVPPEKHYLVPFHSIGKEHGLLAAVELPQIEVEEGEESMVLKRAVVALSEETIAQKGNYQMILHPQHVRQEE